MSSQLMIAVNKTSRDVIIVYQLKSRTMVWRAVKCLRSCDRLLSPPSVMVLELIIRTDEVTNRCHYSLLSEVEINSMESWKMLEPL